MKGEDKSIRGREDVTTKVEVSAQGAAQKWEKARKASLP